MKKILLFSIVLILFNCSKKIDSKDLQGVWTLNYEDTPNSFFSSFIIKDDSITVIDWYSYPLKGKYKIDKNNFNIYLKDNTIKSKLQFDTKDSTLKLLNGKFYKLLNYESEIIHSYNLLNLDSKIKINTENLSKYQSTFHFLKDQNRLKFLYDNEFIPLIKIINDNSSHFEIGGFNIFLEESITTKNLKEFFLYMNLYNSLKVNFITKIDLKNKSYHIFPTYADIWNDELLKLNQIYNIPKIPEYENKETYIKAFNPKLLSIKSKNDFDKLKEIIPNTRYLISVDINLPIKDYLHLTQELNSIRKNKKVKIRTEIIELR